MLNEYKESRRQSTLHIEFMSMSKYVNCRFSTVNIVNIDDIDGKRIGTKVKWIMLLILIAKLTILDFKLLVLMMERFCLPGLEIMRKNFYLAFTQPFYVRKFLLPNPFLFGTNPYVNNERSLI